MRIAHRHRSIATGLAAGVFALGLNAGATDAATTLYNAQTVIGNDNGGAFSFLHTATSNPMTPSGGYTQYAHGKVFAMLDADQTFTVSHDDLGDGLGAGDTLTVSTTLDVLNFSGDPFNNATPGSKIGTLDLSGTLTLGGTSSNEHAFGVSGALDFDLTFDVAPDRQPSNAFAAGDTVSGAYHFQAAKFTNRFNGADIDGETLQVSLWGDSRNAQGQITSLRNGDGSEPLGLDWVIDGSAVPGDESNPTPIPSPSAGLAGLVLMGLSLTRRKRRG